VGKGCNRSIGLVELDKPALLVDEFDACGF
jgi:hypothetical protein